MIGDADLERAVRQSAHPFVGLRVLEIGGNLAHYVFLRCLIHCSCTRALPRRTNGGCTTRAFRSLPRMSTCTLSAAAAGTRAKAIERSSGGEHVPLVISPAPSPGISTL